MWGVTRGCWRVASEFSGFLSRGEGESERGGDAGEREGEERGREGDAGRDAMGLLAFLCFSRDFWGIMGFCFLSGN